MRDAFRERQRGLETEYFKKQDLQLLEKLRKQAHLDEIARALGEKLLVDDPALLRRVKDLGVEPGTGPALLLAPLVQVAWAEGSVSHAERRTILGVAAAGGIAEESPAHALLRTWLETRPPEALFDTALEVIRAGLSVLPPKEREERVGLIIDTCSRVARASGGLGWLLGADSNVSSNEARLLGAITRQLRAARA